MTTAASPYLRHRFPPETITHCVLLYVRFPVSFRALEEMMLMRGVQVSDETIRRWRRTFGQQFANELRRRRPRTGDTWHLDEVFLTINGQTYHLWRAVDQEGIVLDVLVQSRRNAASAKRLMRTLMKTLQCVPRVLITDKLKSDGVAHRALLPSVEHRKSTYLNNRAENSHQPTRQRERAMQRFTSPGSARALPLRLQHDLAARPPTAPPPRSSSLPAGDESTPPHVAGGDERRRLWGKRRRAGETPHCRHSPENSLTSLRLPINNVVNRVHVITPSTASLR